MIQQKFLITLSIVVLWLVCSVEIAAQVYVTRVVGNWHLSGDNSLVREGQTLQAGKRIINPDSNSGEMIEFVGGTKIWQLFCGSRNAVRCRTGMIVPSTTLLGSLWDSVISYWSGDKEKYTVHMVRGDWIEDGVIKLENNEVDLTSLFKLLPKDTYYLKFNPLDNADSAKLNLTAQNAKVEWNGGKNASATGRAKFKDLRPGLYEVIKTDRRGEGHQGSAWVLVAPADKFNAFRDKFTKLKKTATLWNDQKMSEGTSASLLRAGLSYISQELSSARQKKK